MDVKLVVEEPELVLAHLEARGAGQDVKDAVAVIGELGAKRGALIKKGDAARAVRKSLSEDIGKLLKAARNALTDVDAAQAEDEIVAALKARVEVANMDADGCDAELAVIDGVVKAQFESLPNLVGDAVPAGKGESENVVVSEWGTENRLMEETGQKETAYQWHDDIAAGLNGYLVEEAAKLSGARFSVLSGPVAKLERSLVSFMLDAHSEAGYTECSVPLIVGRDILEGTGQLPKFEDDLFKVNHRVNGQDGFLIPTAEVPLTNLYRGAILDGEKLPIHMCAATPCFRAEAGSYGRDVRGLMRQHQFGKVEMVKITTPESAESEHEALTAHAESLLRRLGLPYRKVKLCAGDLGFSARLCYDLEVWLPAQQAYREISSCSNCGDFQSRRMGLRYRAKPEPAPAGKKAPKGKVGYCHSINGSGLAVGRALLAVLETYQRPDGSVEVPAVLRPYMGGVEELLPPKLKPGKSTKKAQAAK